MAKERILASKVRTMARFRSLLQAFLFSTLFATSAALAQESPAEVSDAQISLYQLGLELGCKNAGRRRGEAPEKVEAFCSCASKTLKQSASRAEWQNAYFYNRKRLSREEKEALAAHMPQLESCKVAAQ